MARRRRAHALNLARIWTVLRSSIVTSQPRRPSSPRVPVTRNVNLSMRATRLSKASVARSGVVRPKWNTFQLAKETVSTRHFNVIHAAHAGVLPVSEMRSPILVSTRAVSSAPSQNPIVPSLSPKLAALRRPVAHVRQ